MTEAGLLRVMMVDLHEDSGYKDTFIGHMNSFGWNKIDFKIIQCDFLKEIRKIRMRVTNLMLYHLLRSKMFTLRKRE